MKLFFAFLLCALPPTVLGQSTMKTFTGPRGDFQFQYPGLLVRCTQTASGSWQPASSCAAYTPVCDDPNGSGSHTIACVAYPHAKFESYPAFNAAAFSVAQINVKTQQECFSAPPGAIPPQKPTNGETKNTICIHGTQFHVFRTSDAGMSHYRDSQIYRAFHRTACYQLSVSIATTNPAVFSQPIQQFTAQDRAEVIRQLNLARDSFRFLK